MTNIIADAVNAGLNAASTNPWVAGGAFTAGMLLLIGYRIYDRRKERGK